MVGTPDGGGGQFPDVRVIDGAVGLLEILPYAGIDAARNRQYVAEVYRLLDTTLPNSRCGWIVDFRKNGGGNSFPMAQAVIPFLGAKAQGGYVTADGVFVSTVIQTEVPVPSRLTRLQTTPVAILIGPRTASAGEGTAVLLRTREGATAQLFGQPSMGATTGNATHDLPDGSKLAITGVVMADRTGRAYGGKLEPDVLVSEASTASQADPVVSAAVSWLSQETMCSRP